MSIRKMLGEPVRVNIEDGMSTKDVIHQIEAMTHCKIKWYNGAGVIEPTKDARTLKELEGFIQNGIISCEKLSVEDDSPTVSIPYRFYANEPITGNISVSKPITGNKIFRAVSAHIPVTNIVSCERMLFSDEDGE